MKKIDPKSPVAMFERYYVQEYAKQNSWKSLVISGGGGYTRRNILPIEKFETKRIGDVWNEHESETASLYYKNSESNLGIFWTEHSIFYRYFKHLDCSYIVELACGHGRHVEKYLASAKKVTLVDINKENIDFCKSRFSDNELITYIVNTGCNFIDIDTSSQTSVFCYDAMVHFEMLDVLEYIKDANRILTLGGKILFHHSNIDFYPELSGLQKPLWRNFMSADIFVYLATRFGFKVLSQDVFSFGRGKNFYPNTDCLSLCEKIWTA
jgi:ubiquinone/menaquinone biosynthesis C-methylase UbiE